MATRKKRYQISFDDRLVKRIHKFQEDNGYATVSGAIVELIRVGLETVMWRDHE